MSVESRSPAAVASIALALVLLLPIVAVAADASATASPGEEPGPAAAEATVDLATPEDAVRAYMSGVTGADFDAILEAAAIDEVAEGFRFDLQVDRLQAYVPFSLAPAAYPFYADVNRALRTERVARQVLNLAYSLLSSQTIEGNIIAPADQAWAEDFTREVDPSRLATLTVVDVGIANEAAMQGERYQQNAELQARSYGADELTERVALFYFEGELYYVGFTLVRYGDGWKVLDQTAPMAGTTALGTAIPTTLDDWEALTGPQ
jgi:hypothetical protein